MAVAPMALSVEPLDTTVRLAMLPMASLPACMHALLEHVCVSVCTIQLFWCLCVTRALSR